MKALSLTAPYGTLIALAAKYPELGKKIETRSWSTSYRGELLIHQAKGFGPVGGLAGLRALINQPVFFEVLMHIVPNYNRYCDVDAIIAHLPMGKIVAKTHLVACEEMDPEDDTARGGYWKIISGKRLHWSLTEQERAFGLYQPGRFAWLLMDTQALTAPILYKGTLGLWNYEGAL